MGRKIEYQKGEIVGEHGIEFVGEIPNKPNELRRAKFKCHCGKIFEARITAIKHNEIKSCRCIHGKNRRIEYKQGEIIGDNQVRFIQDLSNNKYNQRQALFECLCGNKFEALVSCVKDGNTKSCGCRKSFKKCKNCHNEFLGGSLSAYCENCRTKVCENCGVEFISHYKKGRGWEKCCSKKCADEQRKGNPVYGHTRITEHIAIFCKQCDKPMLIRNLKRKKERKFCSHRCQGAFYKESGVLRRFGKPRTWRQEQMYTIEYKEWHRDVLERDNYICRECFDLKNIINRDNLIVHHIIPIYVDPDRIVEFENGITLCTKCHEKTLTKELNYVDYYFGLLSKVAPIVEPKQLYKHINIPQVLRKIELGYNYKQVAKHFGMSWGTLRTKLNGVKLPPRSYKPKNGTFYSVLKLKLDGYSVRKIACQIKTTSIKIIGILEMWGLIVKHAKHKVVGLTGNVVRKTQHIDTDELAKIFHLSPQTIKQCRLKYGVAC